MGWESQDSRKYEIGMLSMIDLQFLRLVILPSFRRKVVVKM